MLKDLKTDTGVRIKAKNESVHMLPTNKVQLLNAVHLAAVPTLTIKDS